MVRPCECGGASAACALAVRSRQLARSIIVFHTLGGSEMTSKNRGKNEGSIYQRASDGLWVGSISLGYGPDGKRKRKPIYGKTRREVAEKMKRALRDQQLGVLVVSARQTTGQFLTRWLEDVVRPS